MGFENQKKDFSLTFPNTFFIYSLKSQSILCEHFLNLQLQYHNLLLLSLCALQRSFTTHIGHHRNERKSWNDLNNYIIAHLEHQRRSSAQRKIKHICGHLRHLLSALDRIQFKDTSFYLFCWFCDSGKRRRIRTVACSFAPCVASVLSMLCFCSLACLRCG